MFEGKQTTEKEQHQKNIVITTVTGTRHNAESAFALERIIHNQAIHIKQAHMFDAML